MGAVSSFLHSKSYSDPVPSRQVRTRLGVVEGRRQVDEGSLQVDAFLGIPFAKPPVGPLRFKKPEPPEPWTDVFKAYKFGARAPQIDFIWERWMLGVGKNEDCLTLNVFCPAWKPPDDQPGGFAVMVFVHGGGFVIDSAVKYGDEGICRYLCRHDVIVVTVQYRLGLLGFFTTGEETCNGNLGLWDQTLALKWVNENIASFDGDPNRVTLFGQSAGGASVDLLSMSPHSSHLFQQVIPMAGNAECIWATTDKTRITDVCKQFAKKVGWNPSDEDENNRNEMVEYLRGRPAKQFQRALIGRGGVDVRKIGLDIAPVVDGDFLPKPVEQLRKEAPLKRSMVGTCQYEGLIFAALCANQFNHRGIDKLLSIVIAEDKFPNWHELREQARSIYLGEPSDSNKRLVARAYADLYSDVFVNYGTHRYAKRMCDLGHKVFLYSFEYFNPKSYGLLSLRMPFKGATHCTELTYLFGQSIIVPFKLNENDKKMIELMSKLWTNFAKYGDPNGAPGAESFADFRWEPVSSDHADRYLNIDLKPRMRDGYCERRADFWHTVREMGGNSIADDCRVPVQCVRTCS